VQNLRLPSDLSEALKPEKASPLPRGYGGSPLPIPFSLYARRMLARCGGVFAPASEGRLVFLTGTLPGSTDEAMRALSDWSAWAVHELMTHLPRLAGSKASQLRWEWVWEWQERGALHWHCALELPTPEAAKGVIASFRPLWCRIIRGIGKKAGVDMAARHYGGTWAGQEHKWRVDAQIAKASPSNYLAKYLGKDDSKGGKATGFYPSRWYGCSRRILSECREQTEVFSTHKYRPKKAHEVTDRDSKILGILQSEAETVRAFCDKYRTGFTLVAYGPEGFAESVKSLLRKEVEEMENIYQALLNEQQEKPREKGRIRLPNVDMLVHYPSLLQCFINDLSPLDRATYFAYSRGQNSDLQNMLYLDCQAGRELRFRGFQAPVKGATASEAEPLTGDAPKSLEVEGSGEQLLLYPGMAG
jgi:hypothetical protein